MWQFLQFPALRGGDPAGRRAVVVGAGRAGRTVARDLKRTPEFGLRPVGFLDDRIGMPALHGLPVLGHLDDLANVVRSRSIEVVVIAIPALSRDRAQALVRDAASVGASVRYLPSFLAAIERDARLSDLRALRMHELLGRQEVHVGGESVRRILSGRRVLVTGAGGSIGSELCRQIEAFGPAKLFLLDHDESNLHRLQLELSGEALLDAEELIIADVRDQQRIRQLLTDIAPDVVFHAAAHKHLPLLELHPGEAVKSNVVGTRNLVEAAVEVGTERFILISTDKAADPTSILGATKRLAEMVVQAQAPGSTRFASVRFGNVLGSRGSFLTVLGEQIANGAAVTVTHPDVTRYFMTVEEAVGLVLEAANMAEFGETFVLDMGEPVRIVDLVQNYVMQVHAAPVDIRFTGLRPGEKLNETLFSESERRLPTAHPKIYATLAATLPDDFGQWLDRVGEAATRNEAGEIRRLLRLVMSEPNPVAAREAALAGSAPYPDGF